MNEFLNTLSFGLIDLMVYGAVLVSFLVGMSKCVLPLGRAARAFRRGIANLSVFKPGESGRPDWQDSLFLGKPMQRQWTRFLQNAEQLDQRGLSCDVEDYINDESTLRDFAHFQLAEVIPGLLTSLGILGTFIGLMRGLGSLDLSSAGNTVASIHTMISGMTFAYGTSIAGLVGSLIFNIFFRAAQGSATGAMDDFNQAFAEVVMARPLDDQVRQTCYMEDQATFLAGAFGEVNLRLESGVGQAVERSFAPIAQSMNHFILSETQAQVEGLHHVVNQFIDQMNGALSGQFLQLGKTLSQINQSQSVSHESLSATMAAADRILEGMQQTGLITQTVMERFDGYVADLSGAQAATTQMAEQTAQALSGLHEDISLGNQRYKALVDAQTDLGRLMEQYAQWSGRVLEAVEKQSEAAGERTHEIVGEMSRSGKLLTDGYANFVENITQGLARTMAMFEENMSELAGKMASTLKESVNAAPEGALDLRQFTRVQTALSDMTQALTRATQAAERMAEGA